MPEVALQHLPRRRLEGGDASRGSGLAGRCAFGEMLKKGGVYRVSKVCKLCRVYGFMGFLGGQGREGTMFSDNDVSTIANIQVPFDSHVQRDV